MYHLLFMCLMENAAGPALFVLSVLSATSLAFTATLGITDQKVFTLTQLEFLLLHHSFFIDSPK